MKQFDLEGANLCGNRESHFHVDGSGIRGKRGVIAELVQHVAYVGGTAGSAVVMVHIRTNPAKIVGEEAAANLPSGDLAY